MSKPNPAQTELQDMGRSTIRCVVLSTGSKANCVAISCEDRVLLVDAGLSVTNTMTLMAEQGMNIKSVTGVLLTHEHMDHAKGAQRICDVTGAILVTMPETADKVEDITGAARPGDLRVGGFVVDYFQVPHDAVNPVGFIIQHGVHRIGYFTDAGYVSKLMFERLKGCEVLFLEANHDERMLEASLKHGSVKHRVHSAHGHLSNTAAGVLIRVLKPHGLKKAILLHMSSDSNLPELALNACKCDGVEVVIGGYGTAVII